MKFFGILLLILGLLLGLVALNMDTTVTTEAQNIAGVEIPAQRVNNLGLMDQRRNYLLVAGVMILAGAVFAGIGYSKDSSAPQEPTAELGTKRCPFCAETIKSEAVVCRFCGRDLAAAPRAEQAHGSVPLHIRELFEASVEKYQEWLASAQPEDVWIVDEADASAKFSVFLASFAAVVDACAPEVPGVSRVVKRKAGEQMGAAQDQAAFRALVRRLDV